MDSAVIRLSRYLGPWGSQNKTGTPNKRGTRNILEWPNIGIEMGDPGVPVKETPTPVFFFFEATVIGHPSSGDVLKTSDVRLGGCGIS